MKKLFILIISSILLLSGCTYTQNSVQPNQSDTCNDGTSCVDSEYEVGYDVGDLMPDVTLNNIDGTTTTLYELMEGKNRTIISLEANWCSDYHRGLSSIQ